MVTTVVSSLATAYSTFSAAANGDRVLLANGTYDNPSRKSLTKTSSSAVVEFGAENVGGAIITGDPIDLTSNNIIFRGFDLQYEDVGDGGTYVTIDGTGCQMTRNKCHFENVAPSPAETKWIRIKGNDCTFDHNEVYNKTSRDDMILVDKNNSTAVTNCRILNNHLHDLTDNQSSPTLTEVIRYGESTLAFMDFNGEVAYNLIETIDADTEVFSIKCSNVNIHHNTFKNTNGALTLRQAYNCTVNANTFINTGLRFYGSGHNITRNQIINVTLGGVSRPCVMGSAVVEDLELSPGVAGSAGQVIPSNADYARVKNCYIANNIWANGNSSSGIIMLLGDDTAEAFQPTGNTITSNIIQASTGTLTDAVASASWSANTVSNNILYATGSASAGDMPSTGYTAVNPNLTQLADGSYRCSLYLDTTEVGTLAP